MQISLTKRLVLISCCISLASCTVPKHLLPGDKFQQGGLLALKQLSEGNYRTIFMTKFGMTLFDFEFGDNGFIVHKVMEQMNRKVFLKIIERDMEMLLSRGILGNNAIFLFKKKSRKLQRFIKIEQLAFFAPSFLLKFHAPLTFNIIKFP